MIMQLILIGIIIGFICYWIYKFYTSTSRSLDRVFAVFHNSATIIVARISAMLSLISGVLINWAGDPSMQELLKGALNPKYSWAIIFGLMVLVELARYRSMEKDDD